MQKDLKQRILHYYESLRPKKGFFGLKNTIFIDAIRMIILIKLEPK